MNPTSPCPPITDYGAMLCGRVSADRAAALEAHLKVCPDCQRILEGLASDPRSTIVLQNGPPLGAEDVAAQEMSARIARLENRTRQITPTGLGMSLPGSPCSESTEMVQLGKYRVVRLLGEGGMGLVYLVDDEVLRRQVAVKVLRPQFARFGSAREGFLREARAMASLKHDNVVTVFQVGETIGAGSVPIPFLVMELLEGETLADLVQREKSVSPETAALIGRQASDGLAAAHARGVVHRDIKPGNLWLEASANSADLPADQRSPLAGVGRVKLLDFGLAQPANEDARIKQIVLGTPSYMAPEQAAGQEVGVAADLFSLGVVLYELLTGQLPFPRDTRRVVPIYPAPVPILELAAATPPGLAALVHRLLATDPASRPQSAREVSRELARFGPGATPSGDQPLPAPEPQTRLGRAARVVTAALLLALVAVGLWLVLRPRTTDPLAGVPPSVPNPGPPDAAWIEAVAALPIRQRVDAVVAKLRELNPGFDGEVYRLGYTSGDVTEFGILTDAITDIRPIRGFARLHTLYVVGKHPTSGKLAVLSPIQGLPLTVLNIWNNPNLSDISAARGMPLIMFQAGDTAVKDISPLERMPLQVLAVNQCKVVDLTPVKTLKNIRLLRCDGCPLDSLEPLIGSRVSELRFTYTPSRGDAEVLDRMPLLVQINGLPVNKFHQWRTRQR